MIKTRKTLGSQSLSQSYKESEKSNIQLLIVGYIHLSNHLTTPTSETKKKDYQISDFKKNGSLYIYIAIIINSNNQPNSSKYAAKMCAKTTSFQLPQRIFGLGCTRSVAPDLHSPLHWSCRHSRARWAHGPARSHSDVAWKGQKQRSSPGNLWENVGKCGKMWENPSFIVYIYNNLDMWLTIIFWLIIINGLVCWEES